MAQTSVEWLIEQLQAPCRGIPTHIIDKANKMQEQQIKDAYNQGYRDGKEEWDIWLSNEIAESNAENYYNKTFKSTKL